MANEKQQTAEQKEEGEKTGRLAGAGAGALAGAQVGTVLLPIPVVGTFAGALVGGVIGSEVGKKVGGKILDTIGSPLKDKKEAATSAGKPDVTAELERLAKLREQGVLSDEEFKAAKAKLLGL